MDRLISIILFGAFITSTRIECLYVSGLFAIAANISRLYDGHKKKNSGD